MTLDYYTHAKNDDIHGATGALESDLLGCVLGCAKSLKKRVKAGGGRKVIINKNGQKRYNSMRPMGVEPITYGSEDRCSIQLSYGRLIIYYRAKVIIFKLNFHFPAK